MKSKGSQAHPRSHTVFLQREEYAAAEEEKVEKRLGGECKKAATHLSTGMQLSVGEYSPMVRLRFRVDFLHLLQTVKLLFH